MIEMRMNDFDDRFHASRLAYSNSESSLSINGYAVSLYICPSTSPS